MDPMMIGVVSIVCLIILIFLGMNIGVALMTVGFVGYAAVTNWRAALSILSTVPAAQAGSYSMMVIPLFILMGNFAFRARLSKGLYDFASKWLSRVPGALASATVVACAGFGAICGSTPATCATMGAIALPEMREKKYDDKLSTGSVAIGGTLGILIPPSTPMILYAVLTTSSIGALFSAGVVPGIVLAAMCVLTIIILCKMYPHYAPAPSKCLWRERFASIRGIIGVIILFGVVLGGMFSGWFSVSQASAVGAFLAMLMCIPGKTFNKETILDAFNECVRTIAMTFLIIVGASMFSSVLTISRLPMALAVAINDFHVSRYFIILVITLIYIFLGMIMDALPMMMLTVPIFAPIVQTLGFDLIWFGIYIVLVMCFGSISPPVGICLFIINGMNKDISLGTIFKGIIPFTITLFVMIAVITFFPGLVTFVPRLLFG
jgi:tripartite ATP-independent transporter DctM subunit